MSGKETGAFVECYLSGDSTFAGEQFVLEKRLLLLKRPLFHALYEHYALVAFFDAIRAESIRHAVAWITA